MTSRPFTVPAVKRDKSRSKTPRAPRYDNCKDDNQRFTATRVRGSDLFQHISPSSRAVEHPPPGPPPPIRVLQRDPGVTISISPPFSTRARVRLIQSKPIGADSARENVESRSELVTRYGGLRGRCSFCEHHCATSGNAPMLHE